MNKIDLVKDYFVKFSEKNLEALSDMFADDVMLTDWQIKQKGKKNVLKANKGIFTSVNKLLVKPITITENDDTVMAEITVRADDSAVLNVVDVISFNAEGKITRITAYKR